MFLDWTAVFIEQGTAPGLAAVADAAGAEQAFKTLGINGDDLVVLYDDYSHMFAGRIWWAMRHWGFSNVRVLNGGWKYWTARTGHIPHALNIPFDAVLDKDTGLFLDPETILVVFDTRAPQWRETPIIASCGSGYAATVILLALAQLDRKASLFDGSFAVWKQDPNRPISQLTKP